MIKPPRPPARVSIPVEIAEIAAAKQEWVRIHNLLADKLDVRDHSLLIDYCLTFAEIIELRDTVAIEGRTLTSDKGGSYINPTMNLLISRQSHMASLRRDLYFTPKSRIEKQNKARSRGQAILAGLAISDEE